MDSPRLERPHPLSGPAALEELEVRLRSRLVGRVRGLSLAAVGRGLILRGQARSYYAKQLAQHAVMAMTDVPLLANEIEVC